jgi:hypothetical protein
MLEILALIALTGKIGKIVEKKGYKPGWYKFLTCALWFGGEVFGAIIGAILSEGEMIPTYLIAIIGAAIGAGASYWIAINRPARQLPQTGAVIEKKGTGPTDVMLEIIWKGAYVLMDSEISIYLDEALVGSGSFVKGFSLEVPTTSGGHNVVLKFNGRSTSTSIQTESNKKYRVDIDYSRAWGKFKMTFSPPSINSASPVTT